MSETIDRDVRVIVYRRFVEDGAPPSAAQVAEDLDLGVEEVEASYRRLADARALVLAPGTLNVWMANPLCAYPTPFRVTTAKGAWWGTCVWDALGIPAMLGLDAVIETSDAATGDPIELRVESAEPQPTDVVAHFAVPARQWWDNIGYT